MRYLEQACIPLSVRVACADAALAYAEALALHITHCQPGPDRANRAKHLTTTLYQRDAAHSELLRLTENMASYYKEAI